MKMRQANWQQVQDVQSALRMLENARDLLKRADCPKTTERTRLAISSCKGALRHAGRRAANTPEAHHGTAT